MVGGGRDRWRDGGLKWCMDGEMEGKNDRGRDRWRDGGLKRVERGRDGEMEG